MRTVFLFLAALVVGLIATPLFVGAVGLVQWLMNRPVLALQRAIGRRASDSPVTGFHYLHMDLERFADGWIYALLVGVGLQTLLGPYYPWPVKLSYLLGVLVFFRPYTRLVGQQMESHRIDINVGFFVPQEVRIELAGAMAMLAGFLLGYNLYVWTEIPVNAWRWVLILAVGRFGVLFLVGVLWDMCTPHRPR